MKKSVFVSLPSARGVHPQTSWNVMDAREELKKHDCYLGGSSVYRMPLDLARNELAAVFLSTSAMYNMLLDDDVQVDVAWWPKMVDAVAAGADIVSAPCKLRDHSHGGAQDWSPFNVRPIAGDTIVVGGLRLLECEQTGLGAVLVSRRVIQTLFDNDVKYASRMMPGKEAAGIFNSEVVPASALMSNAPPDVNVFALDDVVFSMKARKNFKIYAAIDVPTCHDGMRGCFAEELERLERAKTRADRAVKPLLGPDGKPARGER